MPPNVGTRSVTAAALSADVKSLIAAQESLEVDPIKGTFERVIAVLVLVKDEMIDDDPFVELAQCCTRACFVLKAAMEGEDISDLSQPVQKAIEILEKTVRYIQSKVDEHVQGTNFPLERPSESIEVSPVLWKAELQKALEVIELCMEDVLIAAENEPSTQPPDNVSSPLVTTVFSLSASVEPPIKVLRRLVSGDILQGELVASIEAVLSSRNAIDEIGHLQERDAQAFIDAVDEALESPDFPLQIRKKCLESLYGACAGHSLLPRSLQIELGDIPTGDPPYSGGFGDVWKCEHRGQQVAVKVLRMYANKDLQKVTHKFCKEFITWKFLRHPNVLPLLGVMMSKNRLAMVSEWMPNGNITQFVEANEDVNRLELLVGVAKGLVYMHEQRMAHGDLKGGNILIDENGNARLADFGLLAIIPDTTNIVSSKSLTQAGTYRWMSPELLNPKRFHLRYSRPTELSDCYALGMVVYEVLSGNVPFYRYGTLDAVLRVLEGKRPKRPQGAKGVWFNDDIWNVLELCWRPTPGDRLKAADVLLFLEEVSRSWSPPQTTDMGSSAEDSTDESEVTSPHAALPESSGRFPSVNVDARRLNHPVVRQRIVDKASLGAGEVGDLVKHPSKHLYKSHASVLRMKSLRLSFFF